MRITNIGIDINKRFFEALHRLKQEKKMKGLVSFTSKYGINRWNFYSVMKEPASHFIKAEWLSFIVTEYGISAEWLLTGKGSFYRNN